MSAGFPRRKHPRLDGYDYSLPGAYFVTVNVAGERCLLAEIRVGRGLAPAEVRLSGLGRIVEEELLARGITLHPRSDQEILEKILQNEGNRYIRRLVELICRFITNFKTDGYTEMQFAVMKESTDNVRTKLFLDICQACYLEYQKALRELQAVDFEDMINDSARVLRECAEMKQRLRFKYIIVDEYQDISRQRFDLTNALREVCDAKVIAVGDDWQSIYAFSGSDITLFTQFEEKMGYARLLKIVRTYRNAQEVIDIQSRKTGALIRCACLLGVIAANGSAQQMQSAQVFADHLGLAFQIRDDMLDVIGNAQELGKSVGTDAVKNTFVQLYGLDVCDKMVMEHTQQAVDALDTFPDNAYMKWLSNSLINRYV